MPIDIRVMGLVPYAQALDLQCALADDLKAGRGRNTALILEHPPVITLGANKKINAVHLVPAGVDVVQVKRGGGATIHNPGQLVVYPVLDIRSLGLTVKAFVMAILDLGAGLLADLGLAANPKLDPLGLWVENRKIASLGVHLSRFVSTHGLALNLQNDLALFNAITPCGLPDVTMTSLAREKNLPPDPSRMAEARNLLAARLAAAWGG